MRGPRSWGWALRSRQAEADGDCAQCRPELRRPLRAGWGPLRTVLRYASQGHNRGLLVLWPSAYIPGWRCTVIFQPYLWEDNTIKLRIYAVVHPTFPKVNFRAG